MMRFMDPFEETERVGSDFGGRSRGGMMPLDAFEKDGVYTMRFDLPDVDPSNIDLTEKDNVLTVTAERPFEDTDDVTWLIRERPSGVHRREVRLGDRLDPDRIDAHYDNGVLTVTIPIREEAKPQRVSISSGIAGKPTTVGSS